MIDAEWNIAYSGTSYSFGTAAHPVFNITTPDFGDYEIRSADTESPRGDGDSFGTDFFGARTIAFDLGVRAASESAARAAVAAFAKAWRGDTLRTTPGAVAMLSSQYRNSERVVFGRPRRFSPVLNEAARNAQANIVADFKCADNLWYDLAETVQTVSIVPVAGGGLLAPLAAPLTTSRSSDRSTGLIVGGEVSTWPVVQITGPITDPLVQIQNGATYGITGHLAYDETLIIDTRPWSRTVTINGRNAAGRMTRRMSLLSRAQLPPGAYAVTFSGSSSTGTAQLVMRWRSAYTTP